MIKKEKNISNQVEIMPGSTVEVEPGLIVYRLMHDEVWKGFAPKPELSVLDWTIRNREMNIGDYKGPYRAENAPYQVAVMNAPRIPTLEEIVFMAASRVGKTVIQESIQGYYIEHEPRTQLMLLPTEKLAERVSKLRFTPFVQSSSSLKRIIGDLTSRKKGVETLMYQYPGGYQVFSGANAPSTFVMYDFQNVNFDEVDQFPVSVGRLGNPIDLGKVRAANYRRPLFIYTSSPTVAEVSEIEGLFYNSNMQFYFVPCPFCGVRMLMLFSPRSQWVNVKLPVNTVISFMKYDKDNASYAVMECGNCHKEIEEKHKRGMLNSPDAMWLPTKADSELPAGYQSAKRQGFHLSMLYSLIGYSWKVIVQKFLEAKQKQDIEKLIVFVNSILGETWNEKARLAMDENTMLARREDYVKVPLGVVVLTAGVDVQRDWIEVVVIGWGLYEEDWLIARQKIFGATDNKETWKRLDEYLFQTWEYENGMKVHLYGACVDSGDGNTSDYVYAYCQSRRRHRVYATKGHGGWKRDIVGKISKRKHGSSYFYFFEVGVDNAKLLLYRRVPLMGTPGKVVTGLMHFNMQADEDYFKQLTAEDLRTKNVRGRRTQVFELASGKRNEVLDCNVLAHACLRALKLPIEAMAEALKKRVEEWSAMVEREKVGSHSQNDNTPPNPSQEGNKRIGVTPYKGRF